MNVMHGVEDSNDNNNKLPKLTIKAKVTDDSKIKLGLLNGEYGRFQAYLHGNKQVNLYSATKQQASQFELRSNRNNVWYQTSSSNRRVSSSTLQ